MEENKPLMLRCLGRLPLQWQRQGSADVYIYIYTYLCISYIGNKVSYRLFRFLEAAVRWISLDGMFLEVMIVPSNYSFPDFGEG